ncbi:amino acid ABC transporter permease [Candidatus Odyssella thessalonicensis]|uniref:amino acid ABC transporter permease n=1 Tax=Candidatus Odyssella thessalonicensis TaxID=84647 RepID=UPI000225BEA9|nr:amino acid ABC transporter permease [Candidatus Odyssella thessalonicensis]
MHLNFEAIIPSIPVILEGLTVTLKFTLLSLLCGLPLGIGLAVAKLSFKPVIRSLASAYTSLFRGTPLLVQLGLIYYATPQLTGYTISAFEAGILTFALNSAAYSSEIIRAGIQSVDKGQWEAAQMLGLSRRQTIFGIIMPQAIRNTLPALVNEMIDLLKESSLISTIGEADLLRQAQKVASEKYLYFEPLILAAACYYIIVMFIAWLAKRLEKRLAYA